MKKLMGMTAILGAAMVAFAAFAPSASAQTPPGDAAGQAFVAGRGVLTAHGSGVAAVKGAMDLHATAAEGILLVKDPTGNARIDVDGYGGTGHWLGMTVYFGFHGNAHIVGRDVGVLIVGRDIDLKVAGRGWAFLRGQGTFSVNGGPPQPWTEEGARFDVAP